MSREFSKSPDESPPIKFEKLLEICNQINFNSSPLCKRTPITDAKEEAVCGSEEARLAEMILKAAFDGRTQKIAIVESKEYSAIHFLDENSKKIVQLITYAHILLGLRDILLRYSWTIDEDGESSDPLHYFRFSEKEQGGIAVLPPEVYLDGTIVTMIEIFHVNSRNYMLPVILES